MALFGGYLRDGDRQNAVDQTGMGVLRIHLFRQLNNTTHVAAKTFHFPVARVLVTCWTGCVTRVLINKI